MKTLYTLCLLAFLALATPAFAQFDTQQFITPQLSIEIKPEYPQPGEMATASINDYSGGVYGAEITWLLNGAEVPDAKNQRNVQITAGASGVTQTIEAVLTRPNGTREVLRTAIQPIYLDMIIEAQTRTPTFYRGRSLPSIGSIINATALVTTNRLRGNDLVYTWQLNNKVLYGGPLRGGNKISFETPMGEDMILSVMVTELNGSVLTRRAVLVPSVTPTISFYEVSSLFGLSQRPIDSAGYILSGETGTVRAEPYNLDSRVYNDADVNQWEVDGVVSQAASQGNPYEITIQRLTGGGSSHIGFHVRDLQQVLQGSRNDFEVKY